MLTIDSNLKIKELDKLCNVLIKSDIINFNIKKVGGGFPKDLSAKIINKLNYKGTVLVINDLSLEMIDELLEAGYKLEDITLAFGKWNNNGTVSDDKIMYNIMKDFIKYNIKEKLNIIFLGDIFMGIKHWDCIIANPPYGAIGANITDYIRQNIDYDLYVNLLPANDYKRNKTKDLFNYQSEMESINDGFNDAAVTTHLALVHKNKVNNLTIDEFIIQQFIDKNLDKYFTENRIRKYYAIDSAELSGATTSQFNSFDINKTVLFGNRDVNHRHLPYSKTCDTYKYNVEKSVDNNYIFDNRKATRNGEYDGWLHVAGITFNIDIEKINFVNFIYSKDRFRFLSKVFTAINVDGTLNCGNFLPKVDWTRPWTIEEILTDYGYTEDEVKEVMNDLINYKGMED